MINSMSARRDRDSTRLSVF